MEPKIIYEDENILAINKPAGLVVHPDGRTEEESVSMWMLKNYPHSRDVGEPIKLTDGGTIERPGIVHRIDRDTSGILLLAKTEKGFEHLKNQFKDRTIQKKYFAFIYGNLKDTHGSIKLPIARSGSDFRKWSAERGARGEKRDALTYYQVLAQNKDASLIEAQPKTGRTHQIRVHFKALQRPIIGDKLYAPTMPLLLGFKRLALHARELSFTNTQEKSITIKAEFPEDFLSAFKEINYKPKDLP